MWRWVAGFSAAISLLVFAAAASSPALAASEQPTYAPVPDWVKPTPIPTTAAGADGSPYQVLLIDRQARLGSEQDEFYAEVASKVLSPEGLAPVGAVALDWDPDTESLVIHKLRILRGDRVIDVLAGGTKFLVLRRENKLELAMLDGRLTATIEPEGLQVGDVVDLAYTLQVHDPALQGHSSLIDRLDHTGVATHVLFRASWSSTKPTRWRVVQGVSTPVVSKTATGSELAIDMTNIAAPKPPLMAPGRYQELGAIEISDVADWPSLSRLMAPVYDKAVTPAGDSPLNGEIQRIAALSSDPKVRAMAALRLVEDQTRYVFLGMNDGGIVPAQADLTWSRRFGDCKGKTALLVALLRGLGIEAEPSLVSTQFGDGLDQRLPSMSWFDHVMVRARIAGKTYWLDGTRVGDRSLDDLVVPRYGWTLPVSDSGAQLVKLEPQPLTQPNIAETLTVDASKGPDAPAPAHLEQVFRGELAVALRAGLASSPRADYERAIRENWSKSYPWFYVASLTINDDEPDGTARIAADGTAKVDWVQSPDGSHFYRVPNTAMVAATSFKREPGPNTDAPYLVTYPYYVMRQHRITLPPNADFTLIGADIDQTVAGQALKRRSRIENGLLTIESSVIAIEPEFPASEAEADGDVLRDLSRKDVAVSYRARSASAAPPAVTAGNLDADIAAAQKGDGAAAFRVGSTYAHGAGVPLDIAAARKWYSKAAEAGDPHGETAMATLLLVNAQPADQAQAVVWLRKAAAQGFAPAEDLLAGCYAVGRGVEKDPAQAVALEEKAAAQGDAQGEALLGLALAHGLGVAQNYVRAFVVLSQSAYQGNALGEFGLAALYHDGLGVQKDTAKGFELARKAADQGNRDAEFTVALTYQLGVDTPRDLSLAATWFEKAAAQGDARAYVSLGIMAQLGQGAAPDYAKAMDLYLKGAALNSPFAMDAIGALYDGGLGVAKDPGQAMSWYQKAAAMNDPEALFEIGAHYEFGHGPPRDLAQAASWFQKAADLGSSHAEAELGALYLSGAGVARDDAKALTLIQKAVAQNDRRGEFLLGYLFEHARGVTQSDKQAFELYSKSAAAGDSQAAISLAVLYRDGRGVAADVPKARQMLEPLAERGDSVAQVNLGILYERGGPNSPPDLTQAMRWYQAAAKQGSAAAAANIARLQAGQQALVSAPKKP